MKPDRYKTEANLIDYCQKKTQGEKVHIVPATLEGCVVRMSDAISYVGQDYEDAIRIEILKKNELPEKIKRELGETNTDIINSLVTDIINNSYNQDEISYSSNIAERVFELIDTQPDIVDLPDAIEIFEIEGKVVFDQVSFGYDEERPVLHGITFTVEPGETKAIVGPTGAGKSTLVSLILRFYNVTDGKIEIDDLDVKAIKQRSLRSKMSIVLQEPFLFSGTVLENICYGKLDASDEEIEQAAKIANAHDFILNLPDGYNTQVGERGGMLSQGQRQLISIARAVLANPRILILDEATASVDTRTEVLIQRALNRLLEGRTSFVIAHRLSTVRNADEVIVLDGGHIVEQGMHNELMARDGLYADLYRRQFFDPQDETTGAASIPVN